MRGPSTIPSGDLAAIAAAAGLRRIHVLAWRDLADDEAGGSEVHIDEIARRWAAAGLELTMRTSSARGRPATETRSGYRVIRRGGRMTVFPRAVVAERLGRHGPADAVIEIWNGVPWGSPLWSPVPTVVWLHHVHGPMWHQTLPPGLAHAGVHLEARLAPHCYRGARVVTLAESSRRELIDELGFSPDRVEVVPPGIAARFTPGGVRADHPLVVAVGRLAPVKRFDLLVRAAATARVDVPGLELVLVGEGSERARLEALVAELGAGEWVRLAGRLTDDELLELYRRAWVVASASLAEGWGMTLSEAAACATPAVATDIVGHRDVVHHEISGLLGDDAALPDLLRRVLTDDELRARLGSGARRRAAELSWDRTAERSLALLAEEVHRCRTR